MTDHHAHHASPKSVPADSGSLLGTIVHLWPYIWPSERADLKARIVGAMVLLLAAKLTTMVVPFTFKWATDALAGAGSAPIAGSEWLLWVVAAPVTLTLAYGGTRILMAVLTQIRDGMFAKVAMHAVRRLAAVEEGADVDDDGVTHLEPRLEGCGGHMRRKPQLLVARQSQEARIDAAGAFEYVERGAREAP